MDYHTYHFCNQVLPYFVNAAFKVLVSEANCDLGHHQ